jgi:hypothetical protein
MPGTDTGPIGVVLAGIVAFSVVNAIADEFLFRGCCRPSWRGCGGSGRR